MNIRPLIRAAALTLFVTGSFNSHAQSSVDNDIPLSRYEMERYPYQPGAYSSKWPVIKEENIAWKKRVWRTITLNEAGNELLALSSLHPSLGDVLINGLYSNAFGPQGVYTTDRFNQQLDEAGIQRLKAGGLTANQVNSIQIKEDWIYLKEEKKMVVRIVAMAPQVMENGTAQPAFWVYYPDARPYLAQQAVAAPGNNPANLDEVFEGRFFSSKILKTSDELKTK